MNARRDWRGRYVSDQQAAKNDRAGCLLLVILVALTACLVGAIKACDAYEQSQRPQVARDAFPYSPADSGVAPDAQVVRPRRRSR